MLALSGNSITGSIPSSIGNLKSLKELHLSSNQLFGMVPTSLNNLEKMETLNIFDNKLTGTLPLGLSHSKNLKKLVIAQNDIIQTEAFASMMFFQNDPTHNTSESITPSGKTVIASENSDDN